MPRTWHQPKELRAREDEVEDLREEEQEERLAEVRLDPDDGERHARDVAEGVAGEGAGWVPVCQKSWEENGRMSA